MLLRPDAPAPRKVAVRVWPRAIPQVTGNALVCRTAGCPCRAKAENICPRVWRRQGMQRPSLISLSMRC